MKQQKSIEGKKLKFGDVVFVDNRVWYNVLGRVIRYVQTGGKTNINYFCPAHAVTVYEENEDIGKVKIIHATSFKVKVQNLSILLNKKKVNLVIKRYRGKLKHKDLMREWLREQIGKDYDVLALAGIYGRYLLMRYTKSKFIRWYLRGKENPLASKKRFVCSELIYGAYYLIEKIKLWRNCHSTNVTPWDIFRSKKLKTVVKLFMYDYKKEK